MSAVPPPSHVHIGPSHVGASTAMTPNASTTPILTAGNALPIATIGCVPETRLFGITGDVAKRELADRLTKRSEELLAAVQADTNQFNLIRQRLVDGASWLQQSLSTLNNAPVTCYSTLVFLYIYGLESNNILIPFLLQRELQDQIQNVQEKDEQLETFLKEFDSAQFSLDDIVTPVDTLSQQ